MENREFRQDVQEVLIRQYAKSVPVSVLTKTDAFKVTLKFAAWSFAAMGIAGACMMVAL